MTERKQQHSVVGLNVDEVEGSLRECESGRGPGSRTNRT